MNRQPFVVAPDDHPRRLNVIGVSITVLASRAATRGYEITVQEGAEGAGPPPHSHPWDESFYVFRGTVECSLGADSVVGAPGTLIHLPAGTVHSFRFGAGGGAMIEIAGQGSRATEIFSRIDREVSPAAPDLAQVAEILEQCGVRIAARDQSTGS